MSVSSTDSILSGALEEGKKKEKQMERRGRGLGQQRTSWPFTQIRKCSFFFHRTIGKYLEIIFIAKLLLILLLRFHCDVLPHKYKAHPVLLDIWKKNGYKPGIEVHACNPTPFENLRTALAREWIYVSKKKLKEKNRLQLNFSLNTVWTQDIQAKRKHFFLFNCSILSIPAYPPRKLPTP